MFYWPSSFRQTKISFAPFQIPDMHLHCSDLNDPPLCSHCPKATNQEMTPIPHTSHLLPHAKSANNSILFQLCLPGLSPLFHLYHLLQPDSHNFTFVHLPSKTRQCARVFLAGKLCHPLAEKSSQDSPTLLKEV